MARNKYGTTNPVLIEARINHDPYDQFGWVQEWRFAIADYLHFVCRVHVPDFHPAPSGPDTDNYPWSVLMAMAPCETTGDKLKYALNILDRYREWLRIAGKDY